MTFSIPAYIFSFLSVCCMLQIVARFEIDLRVPCDVLCIIGRGRGSVR